MVLEKSVTGFEIALQLDVVINDQIYSVSVVDLCNYDNYAM